MLRNVRHRILTLTAGLVAMGTSVAGCAAGDPSSTSAALSSPPLKICTTGDYQPLTYLDPGTHEYTGIDIDMARDLAGRLERTPRFVATTWSTMMADLKTPGKCDIVMGGVSRTAERQQQADLTMGYLSNGKTPLTTTANAARLQTVAQIDQPGVRVIEDVGGTNQQFAQEMLANASLVTEQDNTRVFGELLAGRADVMITDAIEANYQAKQHPGLVAVHPEQPFTADQKVYLLPKGSKLTPEVNRWLASALADGTFDRTYQRWMS